MSHMYPTPPESVRTCADCHFFDNRTTECRRHFSIVDHPGSTSCQKWMSPVRQPVSIDDQLIEDLRNHQIL